ncbi:MAG: hypothetical protein AAFP86_13505, partial [Planctomycetota bacterium]
MDSARYSALTPFALLVLGSAASAQATFTIVGPGRAADVSPDGAFVVGTDAGGAFLWSASGLVSLGQDDAVAVSDDGTVVFGNMTDISGDSFAGRWTAGTGWVPVGALAGSSGSSVSTGYDMSNDGDTATGLGWNSAADGAAFLYESGSTTPLPQVGSGSHRGNAVSGDGRVVGGWDEGPTGARLATLWDASLAQTFPFVDASVNPDGVGEISALSTDGTWAAGFASPNTGRTQGAVWSAATGTVYLGEGPPTGSFFDRGFALGVTDDGQVAVGAWGAPPFSLSGTIWTPSGGLVLFDDFLAANGATGAAGWDVQSVDAITPDGSTLVGTATPSGQPFPTSWFIATVDTSLGTNYCTAVPNSTGVPGVMSAMGSNSVAANNVELRASSLPQGQFGIFVVSMTQGLTTNVPNNVGNLCLGGTIGRYQDLSQIFATGASGTGSLAIDLTAVPAGPVLVATMPGDTLNFQAWHRDVVGGAATSNFTNGLEILFN